MNHLKISANTHQGLIRDNNQDAYGYQSSEWGELVVVCDGIGGSNGGDVASKMASDLLIQAFTKQNFHDYQDYQVKNWLDEVMKSINDKIFAESLNDEKLYGMGTTLVGYLKLASGDYVFHAGDSRIYGLYKQDFICLSEDHTLIAKMLKDGEISAKEAINHPKRHVLTNAIGIWDQFQLDIKKIEPDFDYLLLCSDGLHGYVSDMQIKEVMQSSLDLAEKNKCLLTKALQTGGYDNITIVIVEGVKA